MNRSYEKLTAIIKSPKMLFISGPRQVGKTTFSKNISKHESLYLNWDIPEDKEKILKFIFSEKVNALKINFLILDEIHKYHRFKNALKGLYDRKIPNLKVVVTGSARLETFQKSGDSLLGRYEQLRIHPFTLGELTHNTIIAPPSDWLKITGTDCQGELAKLELTGGFPEPYMNQDIHFYNRWAAGRRNLLIKEDLRELTDVKLISQIEELGILLPSRVGSLLSLNSLKENLGVSYDSIKVWLEILEELYYIYRIKSFTRKVSRGITKSQKMYLWDWAQVEEIGAKLENLVASHLLKSIHLWNDCGYGEYELNFLRNKEKKEINFILLNKRKPIVAIEVKTNDLELSESWFKFAPILRDIPKIQLARTPNIDKITASGIRIVSMDRFLSALN